MAFLRNLGRGRLCKCDAAMARRVRSLGWSGTFEFDKDSIVGLIVSILNWTDLSRVGCRGAVQCVEVRNLLVVDGNECLGLICATSDIEPSL